MSVALYDSQSSNISRSAVKALGYIGSDKAVESLLTALTNHSRLYIRASAASALGKIARKRTINSLLIALNDSSKDVRMSVADALGNIGGEQVVESLLKALNDSKSDVRRSAAMSLGKIGDARCLAELWQLCHKQPSETYVWSTITSIQNRCQFYNYEIFQAHLAGQKARSPSSKVPAKMRNKIIELSEQHSESKESEQ